MISLQVEFLVTLWSVKDLFYIYLNYDFCFSVFPFLEFTSCDQIILLKIFVCILHSSVYIIIY